MESTRAHSFRLILLSVIVLSFGFVAGSTIVNIISIKKSKKTKNYFFPGGANSVAIKRNVVIKQALKQRKEEYDFEVAGGVAPVLNK